MSRFFIELSDSTADRLWLDDSKVDKEDYYNNYGYMVYAVADLQCKFCAKFPTAEAREEYINENGIDDLVCYSQVLVDAFSTWIWEDTGSREIEIIPVLCDVDMVFVDLS